jgi:hypothetical protein
MKNLTVKNLSKISKNWDRRTTETSLWIDGHGNMWGGSSRRLHVCVHGDNSIHPTGKVEVIGVITVSYNIARGANGETSSSAQYYKGVYSFDKLHGVKPTISAEVIGNCSGAESAISHALGLTSDTFQEILSEASA